METIQLTPTNIRQLRDYAGEIDADAIVGKLDADPTRDELELITTALLGYANGGPRGAVYAACDHLYGDPYGDGMTVIAMMDDYAEPGYRLESHDGIVVTGNWNTRYGRDGEPGDNTPRLLSEILEALGVSLEWDDEWDECAECYDAVRVVGNSYQWRPYYIWTSDGPVCGDCLAGELGVDSLTNLLEGETALINNPDNAITFANAAELEHAGWREYSSGHQTGWHDWMDADPKRVYAAIRSEYNSGETDIDSPGVTPRVVFLIDETSQFYMGWSAWLWGDDLDALED